MKLEAALGGKQSPDTLRRAAATFRPALAGQGRRLVACAALALVGVALELLRPWPIKVVFDRILITEGPAQGIWGLSAEGSLFALAGSVLVISLLIGAVSLRTTILAAEVGRKATTRVRRQVFDHIHRLDLPFHQSSRTGDLLARLMGDVNMVRDLLFASWLTLLERGTMLVGTAAVMLVLDPMLAFVALVPLPVLWWALGRSSRQLKDVTRKQRRREGAAAAFASESLQQIRLVKAYAAEERATDNFARQAGAGERASLKSTRITAKMSWFTEALTGAGLALVLLVGTRKVLRDQISVGELIVFISYARSVYKPLRKLSNEGGRLSKATACAGRLLEVLDIAPEDASSGRPAFEFAGDLEFRDVRYRYPDDVEALRGLSFRLAPGTLAVVSGPNGSGKSTTVSMLLRLVSPDSGQVLVDGHDISGFRLDEYRSRFAYVPQEVLLFGASIRDNILYGRPDADEAGVQKAAELALVDDVIERVGGYDALLGEGGATLSGGEARRLMLARAAVRDARIVLLDEPLDGGDPEARDLVARAIRRIAAWRTTIVVNHGPADEISPDALIHLADGRVESSVRHLRPASTA
ncbi:ABC transporter ATP-binding protein [soil metagenome]